MSEYEDFNRAKILLQFKACLKKATKQDGSIDNELLDKLIKEQYEYMKNRVIDESMLNAETKKNNLSLLEQSYLMLKDKKSREMFNMEAKIENWNSQNPLRDIEVSSKVIKKLGSKPLNEKWYDFYVKPESENAKSVLIKPFRTFVYSTKLGIVAELNSYEIVKTISGINRRFFVTTHTDFGQIDKLIHSAQPLTEEEQRMVNCFYLQMSDVHLLTSEKHYNGYIGTITKRLNTATIDYDEDDLAVTKIISEKYGTKETNRLKENHIVIDDFDKDEL